MPTSSTLAIPSHDGESFNAYVAAPEGQGPFPAVVVIQEIFGVNAVVRDVAEWLAGQGYLAYAPDLFWRIEPGIDITDQSEAEWKRAFELYTAFDVEQGVKDIASTIDAARADPRSTGKVGAVGYCLGGLLAYLTATRTDSDASVSYYGVGIVNFLAEQDRLKKPLLMHIAAEDQFVPKDQQQRIIEDLTPEAGVEIHVYEGCDHAFARPRGQHYNAEAAELANRRTLDFLKRNLG